MSPNYPDAYPHLTDCIWRIAVAPRHRVVLTFNDFELENATNCRFDYVAVSTASSQARLLTCLLIACLFYRVTHIQHVGIAQYMLGSGVRLSVCHKVTRRCFVNVSSRSQQKTEMDIVSK